MRSVNYFKNRFEFAMQNTGTIKVNQTDINALNDLIAFANGNKSSELEDSLLLFWVFYYWSLEINNDQIKLVDNNIFLKLTNIQSVFDRLCTRLLPKNELIKDLTNTLQSAQLKYCFDNFIPIDNSKLIPADEVREMTENILKTIKNDFAPISQLDKFQKVIFKRPEILRKEFETN